jgi:dTDP-4-dehydrorhamnose reductase
MRVLLTGAGGLLGRHLAEELPKRGFEVDARDNAALPLEDAPGLAEAARGAALIVNPAAYTDVDGSERDPERAFLVNGLGAENVARAAAQAGAILIHVSTDFVFDGASERPYDEFDPPRPASRYGRSKRAGEILAERAWGRTHVARVQGLYGAGGRNFASKLVELLRAQKPLRLDRERRVQPTSARAAARMIAELATGPGGRAPSLNDRFGVWHLSCRGETTWHGFADFVANRLGLPRSWEPVASDALTLPAPRPPNCLFDHRRLAIAGFSPPPTWQEALEQHLEETCAV